MQGNVDHYSVFALAPQPLLIKLGTLLNDIHHVRVFQKQREPQTWRWQQTSTVNDYIFKQPSGSNTIPVLVISLSGTITHDRIEKVTFLFSIGLSAMAGYETVNWGKELLYDGSTIESKNAILYGGALSLEVEAFLSDRTILLIHGRERLLFGSSINKIHLQVGVGIKFIIND